MKLNAACVVTVLYIGLIVVMTDLWTTVSAMEMSSSTCSFVVLRCRRYLIQAQQSRDSQLNYTFVALAFKQVPGMRKTGGIDRHVNTVVVVFALSNKLTHS